MSPVKPSGAEEEFFAREEAEKLRKLQADKSKVMSHSEKAELKDLHFMKCPKCGMDLMTLVYRGVEIDKCSACSGVWLDDGELEKLSGEEGMLRSVFSFFKDV
jgi:hypothetical protein